MAIETELKLRIAPEHMARLKRHPFLRSLPGERAKNQKLYSVYFDTPDLRLHHDRMALRLRRVGKRWIQTLKGGGRVQAGLHQRNEWETPVPSENLDFNALETIRATHLSPRLRKEIQPLFVTDFTRYMRLVKFEGAIIEISLDSGEIHAGKFKQPISELELELKEGDSLQLFHLALALMDIVPLSIETTSKAEFGYRLHATVKSFVSKAVTPELDLHTTVENALQSMLWSCLFHLQSNVPGAINKTDDEYLHQVRIALRRLRVALKMTAQHRSNAELEYLNTQIGNLGRALGCSREWDVFVTETLPSIIMDVNSLTEQSPLARESEKRRQDCHRHVYAALHSQDFQRLLLRFGAWMSSPYWSQFDATKNLQNFYLRILKSYRKKICRRGECIQEKLDYAQLHKLRIACKNLRYSTELFASLFEAKDNKKNLQILTKLQNVLGKLNDNIVALRLLDELGHDPKDEHILLVRKNIFQKDSKYQFKLRKVWKEFRESAICD